MGSNKGNRDQNAGRSSTKFHKSHRRSQRHELLGKAGPSQSDVLTAKEGRYTILMMWKILHKVVPNCCKIDFIETLRHGTKAVIPSLSKCSSPRNQTLYDSSFAVRGSKLWNKVPVAIKAEKRFDGFKVSLSNFLVLIPDNPPVSGYTCSWSNSLVDFTSTRWSDI